MGDNTDNRGDLVTVGDGDKSVAVSMQVVQSIYNELTGKTEQLSQSYKTSFQIEFQDIQQLNNKIKQLCEQYNIESANCSVNVFHSKDKRQQFSSFDRFSLYDQSILNPTESVLIEYNFLIKLPKVERLQNYKVTIKLASRVTLNNKIKNEINFTPGLMDIIVQLTGGTTAIINIEYVDYVVARSILEAFESWINGVKASHADGYIGFAKQHSHLIPRIAKYSLSALIAFYLFKIAPTYLNGAASEVNLYKALIISFLLIYVVFRLANYFGEITENVIDQSFAKSYIKLNRGDEKQLGELSTEVHVSIAKGILGIAIDFLIGVIAAFAASKWQ